ncbi:MULTISPECIES: energy transducer TonB [Novacetimonas]|uniref:Energy transducer TonB n=2 Tax=Novacetimonas hansenii TaxID=436 RepID=A0AAW5ENY0_NOVHA|nr:energy transducer TonB [Novacetimonas hansenii]EFG85657.1 TonB family protein [Novacetimonas hansenii ATCC 23769]MBL7238237.1 energy transducer TonB [Novacetimonas hansenii]MCJ8353439.1 energy transducer TonB [Novacetimonas hansenii]PYD72300.1 energy transducer TonB [Novacetimonas hansenii]RFP00328.1 energy transducer TonB [Novacetimonas hansenii]
MTVTLSPSSRYRHAVEPVLIPRGDGSDRPAAPPPAAPSRPNSRENERLESREIVPRPTGYRNLHPVTSGLIRPDTLEEPGAVKASAVSAMLHAALLAAIIISSAHHNPHGDPSSSSESPQVEMVFSPPSSSGMEGQSSPDMAGGADAPKQESQHSASESATAAKDQSEDSSPAPNIPTPETPSSPPLTQAPSDLSVPQSQEQKQFNPGMQSPGHSSHPAPQPRHQSASKSHSSLHSPMDLSFAPSPLPHRTRHGRAGGSGSPIDLSVGPLVSNGRINAPYSTNTQIHGVSDDYASELDQWIRSHMYYPEDAARAGEEGPSSVHVVLDRNGQVAKVRLTGQSGSYYLDAATTGMFRNAQLPPVPPDMSGDHFDIDLTINYILIRH